MAQHKLETQFRDKLNSREIKPTEMAWNKLDAMLLADEKTKNKFPWFMIAASFVGFLLIATVFFNQKDNKIDLKKNIVVVEKTNPKESSKTEIKTIKSEPTFSVIKTKTDLKPLVQNRKNFKNSIENVNLVAHEKVVVNHPSIKQNETIAEHKNVSSENIEQLQTMLEKDQNLADRKSMIKVNSTELLSQVDGELQVSFREKALNAITKKYQEAKEALVNRNNQ